MDVQNKQSLDRFYPTTLALWATLAVLGTMAPAKADTGSTSTSLPTDNTAQVDATPQVTLPTTPAIAPESIPTASLTPTAQPAAPVPIATAARPINDFLQGDRPNTTQASITNETTAINATEPQTQPAQPIALIPRDSISFESVPSQSDAPLTAQTTAPQTTEPTLLAQGAPNEPRVLVAEIQINGTDGNPALEQVIINAIQTRAGRPATVTQIRDDVNRIYATGLFANVLATPADTTLGVRVTFDVQPNPTLKKVVAQALPLDGNAGITPPEEIDRIFGDRYGQIINLNDFQEGSSKFQQLQQWYQENGYDLAKVIGIDEPTPDGVVTLVVVEGILENIKVNFINADNEPVDGKTRDFIVTREMQLKPGDVFRRNVAQQDLQRIFGLGLFEDIKLDFATGTEDPTKAILNVNVIEANTGSIAAGGGVSSASGLFGSISYQQQNLGGNNQRLATEFQLGTRDLAFDVSFSDPWIAGDPYRTSYSANAYRRRSISLIFDGGGNEVRLPNGDRPRINRSGVGVTFSRGLKKDVFNPGPWRGSLGFTYDNVRITDGDGDTSFIDEQGNQLSYSDNGVDDILALRLNFSRDKRFTVNGAPRGSVLRFGTDQTIPLGNIFFNRLRGSYSFYTAAPLKLPTFVKDKPHTLAFNLQGGTILGDFPAYEAFSLGGSNSVRGFDEGEVGAGKSYLQATAEYRFPIFSIVGGALFADYATDLGSATDVPGDPAGVRGKPGNGFGYGVGVRVDSPLGQIRVDYGIADNDSRIHFGIGERF